MTRADSNVGSSTEADGGWGRGCVLVIKLVNLFDDGDGERETEFHFFSCRQKKQEVAAFSIRTTAHSGDSVDSQVVETAATN